MVRNDFGGTLEECPMWSFDGSSTEQADGNDSDCLLKPVAIIPDPERTNAYLVMTEVLNADGTAHESNGRATIDESEDDDDFWFGFEQEYFWWDTETNRHQASQLAASLTTRPLLLLVGAKNAHGRHVVEEHLDLCLEAGLNVEGINAEVAAGQWEFQIFAKGAKRAGDEIWLGRYLLERTAEKYGYAIEWHLSLWATPTGTVLACTPTSPMAPCVTWVTSLYLPLSVKSSVKTSSATSAFTVQTTTSV